MISWVGNDHRGSICTDFVKLIEPSLDNKTFQAIRRDFETMTTIIIPHKNEHVQSTIEMSIEELMSRIDDDEFYLLSPKIQQACLRFPSFQSRLFLQNVAKGRQDKADKLLTHNPERTQKLLNTQGSFTDYSGRKFTDCSAYEYGYWAKDTHMCRMLEAHMDEPTKIQMLKRCEKMALYGLTYEQRGEVKNSKTFSFAPLINAYNTYIQVFNRWVVGENIENVVFKAWMAVGLAQRDVPVHVINEYCHPSRSFDPMPTFKVNEYILITNEFSVFELLLFPSIASKKICNRITITHLFGGNRQKNQVAQNTENSLVISINYLEKQNITILERLI